MGRVCKGCLVEKKEKMKVGICELCKRGDVILNRHHLVPKQKKGKNKLDNFIDTCIPCSKQIHALFTNKELKREYNSLETLKSSKKIRKWIKWVRKKNPIDIRYSGKGGFHK